MNKVSKIGIGVGGVLALALTASLLKDAFTGPAVGPQLGASCKSPITVTGAIGSEKNELLKSKRVLDLFAAKCLTLSMQSEGSYEMIQDPQAKASLSQGGWNIMWPASSSASEFAAGQGISAHTEGVFSTQLVVYTRKQYANALESRSKKDGIAYIKRKGDYFEVDALLIYEKLTKKGITWDALGVAGNSNVVQVQSTSPTKSNSGAAWALYMADSFAGASSGNADTFLVSISSGVGAKVAGYFNEMGMLSDSSGRFFDDFLNQGTSAPALAVGYENSIIAHYFGIGQELQTASSAVRPFLEESKKQLVNDVVVLYPKDTYVFTHPVMVLTKADNGAGEQFADVVTSTEFNALVFEEGGFRNQGATVPSELSQTGLAKTPPSGQSVPKLAIGKALRGVLEQKVIE
jgi:hypothetical protein